MTKFYKITDMSQLALVKDAFDDRKVPANQLRGSYLYDAFFGSAKESLHAYRMLEELLKNNGNVLYFSYKYGTYSESINDWGDEDDEVVPLDRDRYSL